MFATLLSCNFFYFRKQVSCDRSLLCRIFHNLLVGRQALPLADIIHQLSCAKQAHPMKITSHSARGWEVQHSSATPTAHTGKGELVSDDKFLRDDIWRWNHDSNWRMRCADGQTGPTQYTRLNHVESSPSDLVKNLAVFGGGGWSPISSKSSGDPSDWKGSSWWIRWSRRKQKVAPITPCSKSSKIANDLLIDSGKCQGYVIDNSLIKFKSWPWIPTLVSSKVSWNIEFSDKFIQSLTTMTHGESKWSEFLGIHWITSQKIVETIRNPNVRLFLQYYIRYTIELYNVVYHKTSTHRSHRTWNFFCAPSSDSSQWEKAMWNVTWPEAACRSCRARSKELAKGLGNQILWPLKFTTWG